MTFLIFADTLHLDCSQSLLSTCFMFCLPLTSVFSLLQLGFLELWLC